MKKLLFLFLIFFSASASSQSLVAGLLLQSAPSAPWTIIDTVSGNGNKNVVTVTINATSAKLIVINTGYASTDGVLTDGHNTYTAVASRFGSSVYSHIYYCLNPTFTSGSLVITYTGSSTFPSMNASTWNCSGTTVFVDIVNNGINTTTQSLIQPGSATSSFNNELWFTTTVTIGNGTVSGPAGWTMLAAPFVSGIAQGAYMSYFKQLTTGALNPITTSGASNLSGCQSISFRNN